jgi:hypothetical protein
VRWIGDRPAAKPGGGVDDAKQILPPTDVALENNGYFVMLIDKRNPVFVKGSRGLIPVLRSYLPADVNSHVSLLYIQDVLPVLEKYGYSWVGEFRKKYGM